jgi:lysophospholipase L1-like esterase
MREGPPRRWPANLALVLVTTTATLGAAELLLRATWTVERVTILHDPLLGFRGRPHGSTPWTREMAGHPRTVRLNAEGFHDHERTRDVPPGTRRIAFVGDSFLEAYQVDIDAGFAPSVGRRLTNRARPEGYAVETINQGVHGYGLGVYALQVRERLSAWHPDAVVLCLFLGNDLHDNFTAVASPAVPRFHMSGGEIVYLPVSPAGARTWLRDNILAHSVLVRFVWMRVIKTSGGAMGLARAAGMVSTPDMESDAEGRLPEMLTVAAHLLERIATDLRQRGVPLFVFVIPDPFYVQDLVDAARDGTSASKLRPQRQAIESGVLQVLRELGVAHLYPRDAFVQARLDGDGYYRNGFGHFTDEAHRVVAKALEEPLWRLLVDNGLAR